MINKSFYTDNNLFSLFGRGLQHYLPKEPTTTISSYKYAVQSGETMYILAKRLFGPDGEHNWTIISDINYARRPDELVTGEIINLPLVVLDDTRFTKPDYGKTTSTTTKI